MERRAALKRRFIMHLPPSVLSFLPYN
jgi:hypothetical protein